MAGVIHELHQDLINKIAAGEVIESSHSVVKELIENSLDANSTDIQIETKSGGLEYILVSDNGSGISEDDLELSIKRHATSKISKLNDLESVSTYGFRGEALASIASVSKMQLLTGTSEDIPAFQIICEKGIITEKKQVSGRKGTKIEVLDLFYNTPVRRKFLKSERSEDKKIKDRVSIEALAKHDVSFQLFMDNKKILNCKSESLKDRIVSIFGESMENHLLETSLERRGIKAHGFISEPDFYRSNRNGQFIFINNRPVEIKYSSYLLKKSYDELLPPGGHPWCFLFFSIDPKHIDVNVHPTKKEIRFLDEEYFNSFFLELVNSILRSKTPVTLLEMKKRLSAPVNNPAQNLSVNNSNTEFQQILHESMYSNPVKQKPFELENIGHGIKIEELTLEPKKNREFVPKRHFGIIFETFILAEAEDGLYIIDQHTAHERIRYEEVLNKFKKNILTQPLLTPMRIDLSIDEANEVLSRKSEYEKVGLIIDEFDSGTILVREVPSILDSGKERETIVDFLNRSLSEKIIEKELFDLMAKCIACRSAIKKGDIMSDHILGEILNRLSYCENPSRCPHGRPTLIKLTRDDLEKMFHRK